jgi:hypothetical protein
MTKLREAWYAHQAITDNSAFEVFNFLTLMTPTLRPYKLLKWK